MSGRTLCFALDLVDRPELIAEYERLHEPGGVWPEVLRDIHVQGVRRMEIWRSGNRLVMVAEVEDDYPRARSPDPKVAEWEALMWRFQQPLPHARPGEKWVPMTKIFELDEHQRGRMNDDLPRRRIGRTELAVTELGFGAASMGNLYAPVSDEDACATIAAALDAGVGYFDTAPYYGFGLSERRIGDALRTASRAALSTKVGRLLVRDPGVTDSRERHGFCSPMPFKPVFDYRHDAILRSFEDSLQRLGLARVDIVYVHDIGRLTHGDMADHYMEQLTAGGGLRALERLREQKLIGGFGIGVNEVEVCLDILGRAHLDVILLAGRYTLLEQGALAELFPLCEARGVSVVIGGAYNSGILATGASGPGPLYYNYAPAPPEIAERVRRIEAICARHDVPIAAAALQFPLAHPVIASVIPGLGSVRHVGETLELYRSKIPPQLWADLRTEGLIAESAPIPADAT